MTENPHVNVAIDAGIATGSVLFPILVQLVSNPIGSVTAILGLGVVFMRFIIAVRDLRQDKDEE